MEEKRKRKPRAFWVQLAPWPQTPSTGLPSFQQSLLMDLRKEGASRGGWKREVREVAGKLEKGRK